MLQYSEPLKSWKKPMDDLQCKTRIVIAEDHQVFRDGLLMALLRRSHIFEVVGEADTGYKTRPFFSGGQPYQLWQSKLY